jgi:hypothetical protein
VRLYQVIRLECDGGDVDILTCVGGDCWHWAHFLPFLIRKTWLQGRFSMLQTPFMPLVPKHAFYSNFKQKHILLQLQWPVWWWWCWSVKHHHHHKCYQWPLWWWWCLSPSVEVSCIIKICVQVFITTCSVLDWISQRRSRSICLIWWYSTYTTPGAQVRSSYN